MTHHLQSLQGTVESHLSTIILASRRMQIIMGISHPMKADVSTSVRAIIWSIVEEYTPRDHRTAGKAYNTSS